MKTVAQTDVRPDLSAMAGTSVAPRNPVRTGPIGEPSPPPLTASDIHWGPPALCGTAPLPSTEPLAAVVLDVLPVIHDDLSVELIEVLAIELIDRDEELRATRSALSVSLELSRELTGELDRVRARHHQLIDEYRALRVKTLRQPEAA